MKNIIRILILAIIVSNTYANKLISEFPLEKYDQNINNFIQANQNYNQPLISPEKQQAYLEDYLAHYYASDDSNVSPWGAELVEYKLATDPNNNVISQQAALIKRFYANQALINKGAYGANFRPYSFNWFQNLANNMNLTDVVLHYQAENRAIAISNLALRALPTNEPLFYNYNLAGEGYPFDNLQETQILIGMPLYVVQQTADKAWSLVIATDAIGWVPTNTIAYVKADFIAKWQKAAKHSLLGIINKGSLETLQGKYIETLYPGTSLPLIATNEKQYQLLVPQIGPNGFALIKTGVFNEQDGVKMPLALTPHNMAMLIQQQIGTTYGWGNSYFDRDCSSETKTLFNPFAIYLPRNSANQATAGNRVAILDKLTSKEREEYLLKNGHPLVTLIQIPGHILLYLGNYSNPVSKEHELIAMSYQNIWGLSPKDNSSRAIIGSSVIFPLLATAPENKDFVSFYDSNKRKIFRLIFLD